MSDLLIRAATPADLDRAADICVAAYDAAGQLEPGSPYVHTLRDTRGRLAEAILLVAERDGTVVGTVTICPTGSPYAEIGTDEEVEFRFLAVDPAQQGTGVGTALIEVVDEHARALGAARLAICVRDTNTGAAAMYERMGFVRAPHRDWTPRAGVDLLALERTVDESRVD